VEEVVRRAVQGPRTVAGTWFNAAVTGALTTHVLDVARGRPAGGVGIELWREEVRIAEAVTGEDGRTAAPLLAALEVGVYELRFAVGAYFAASGEAAAVTGPAFLDVVPVRFGVADADAHHHVPLLVTPWSYSTYRGS
jgi:5-hydroxyisourate hydrolase